VSRKMLVNAQRPEEIRVAIVTEETLDTYEVAAAESGLRRGNIYRGIVASVQPSLDAAFVDIDEERHALLKAEDVVPALVPRRAIEGDRRPRVNRILERGQSVLVQVTRDAVGTKGPVVTTNVSIAGRYLVLKPMEDSKGVSRKVEDEDLRRRIRERLDQLALPEGYGIIVRTNAADQPKQSLHRDLNALLRLWKRVRREASQGKGPQLVYSDQDLLVQALRDLLDPSIDEVLVDNDEAFEKARAYMQTFMPRAKTRLTRYRERMPLFSRYQLETQIDSIYRQRVELRSGGSIVIESTEALTAIDVNSGRATKAHSHEETAYAINLEAAEEVGRQLRLRDIGGLVVVDFIDMRSAKHRSNIEKAMRDAMKADKARTSAGRLSSNGLLEINRQRLKQALSVRSHRPCPTCNGAGTIASPELVGLNMLRRIETRAVTGTLKRVRIALHPELADALQNGRRHEISALESEFDIRIEIIAATNLHRAEEQVEWFARDEQERVARATERAAFSAADLAREEERRPRQQPARGPEGASKTSGRSGSRSSSRGRSRGGAARGSATKPAASEAAATEAATSEAATSEAGPPQPDQPGDVAPV